MLGRLRRTTRIDVGLALCFSGTAYLVWALVAGGSRQLVQELIRSTAVSDAGGELPRLTQLVKVFFVDTGFVIDLVGLAWLVASLVLVVLSSRQKISISWPWVSAVGQVMIAALGAVLVGLAAWAPFIVPAADSEISPGPLEQVSRISLPILVPIAVVVWVTILIWLLVERARFNRLGPTLRDGLHTNVRR